MIHRLQDHPESSALKQPFITPADYLARERLAETKSEYHDGQIYAMSGASRPHSLVAANFSRVLGNQILDRPCELYVSEMRVRVNQTGLYTYPDLVVVCGEPLLEDDKFDTLLNPNVIIEILSPSTESWDRKGKFAHYQRLDSLTDYVLVAQKKMFVEHYTRQGEEWVVSESSRPADLLDLPSIQCQVSLREICAKVLLEADV